MWDNTTKLLETFFSMNDTNILKINKKTAQIYVQIIKYLYIYIGMHYPMSSKAGLAVEREDILWAWERGGSGSSN